MTTAVELAPSSPAPHVHYEVPRLRPSDHATRSSVNRVSFPRSKSFSVPAAPRTRTLSSPSIATTTTAGSNAQSPAPFLYTYSSVNAGFSDLASSSRRSEREREEEEERLRRSSRAGHPLVHSRTMPLRDLREERQSGSGRTRQADEVSPDMGPTLVRTRKETLPADYWARAKADVDPLPSSSTAAASTVRSGANGLLRSRASTSASSSNVPTTSRPTVVEGLEAKIVFLGSPAVGKTSIIQRFTTRRFAPSKSTIGTGLSTRKQVVDGVRVSLQLWDAAGQERYRSLAPMYYRGAHVAILVYDTTSRKSFDDLKSWLGELKENGPQDVIIHVVGAKADLKVEKEVDLPTARNEVRAWLQPTPPATPSVFSPTPPSGPSTPISGGVPLRPSLSLTTPPATSRLNFAVALLPTSPTASTVDDAPAGAGGAATSFFAAARTRRKSGDWAMSGFGMDPPLPSSSSGRGALGAAGDDGLRRKSEEWSRRAGAGGLEKRGVSFRGREGESEGQRDEDEEEGLEGIKVWETSASTSQGIEPLFLHITRQLISKGDQLERERLRKARESVMLDEPEPSVAAGDGRAGRDGGKGKGRKFGGGCCT